MRLRNDRSRVLYVFALLLLWKAVESCVAADLRFTQLVKRLDQFAWKRFELFQTKIGPICLSRLFLHEGEVRFQADCFLGHDGGLGTAVCLPQRIQYLAIAIRVAQEGALVA